VVNTVKQFTAFILLSFIATVSLAKDDLTFPIQQGMMSDWKYVSDRVMGGVSEEGTMGDSFSYVLLSLYLKSRRCFS